MNKFASNHILKQSASCQTTEKIMSNQHNVVISHNQRVKTNKNSRSTPNDFNSHQGMIGDRFDDCQKDKVDSDKSLDSGDLDSSGQSTI